MVDTTWTNGGGDGKASTAANWSNGIDVGYNVIFDGTSTANCTFDYDGQLGTFTIAAGYTGTITQSSDMHIAGYSQAAGTFTGITTKWVYCNGDWRNLGGILTFGSLKLYLSGNLLDTVSFNQDSVTFANDINITNTIYISNIIINSDCTVSIALGKELRWQAYSGTLTNNGYISGNGYFHVRAYTTSFNYNPGLIDTEIRFSCAATTASRTVTLIGDLYDDNLISITADTYNLIIDLNGHNLTATTITVGTRGILQCGEGMIKTNALNSSAGSIIPETAQWIFDGAGTVKTNGSDKFYDVVVRDDALVTLASNVTVSNELVTAGEIALAGNTLTHESPSKRYSAPMINPIVRNPKRSPIFRGRFTRNFEKGVV